MAKRSFRISFFFFFFFFGLSYIERPILGDHLKVHKFGFCGFHEKREKRRFSKEHLQGIVALCFFFCPFLDYPWPFYFSLCCTLHFPFGECETFTWHRLSHEIVLIPVLMSTMRKGKHFAVSFILLHNKCITIDCNQLFQVQCTQTNANEKFLDSCNVEENYVIQLPNCST